MDWLQQVQVWATVAAAFAAACTFGALIWYTIETQKLRRAAEKQNEIGQLQNERSILPIVLLEGTNIPVAEDANMPSFQTAIHNLGSGSAFNILIEPLQGPKTTIRFEHTTALAAGDSQPVRMMVVEDGKQVASRAYQNICRMFHNRQLVTGSTGVIKYSDVNGTKYRTILAYNYDELTREVILKFDRMEPEAPG